MNSPNVSSNQLSVPEGLIRPDRPVLDVNVRKLSAIGNTSVYGDTKWDLSHGHLGRHIKSIYLDFEKIPVEHREATKYLMYNVLNRKPNILPKNSSVYIIAVSTANHVFNFLDRLTRWMSAEGVNEYGDLDRLAILRYVRSLPSKHFAALSMMCYSRVWCHNHDDSASPELPRPPWFESGLEKFIGNYMMTLENSTPPIPTEVMTPLFRAALTVCEWVLSGDVVAARLDRSRKTGLYSNKFINVDKILGASSTTVARDSGETRLNPNRTETRAAAAIVLSYLTGMRTDEVLNLKRGCLEVVEAKTDDGSIQRRHYLIHGTKFKNARRRDSSLITEGVQRAEPWVTLQPAQTAIAVLESLSDDPVYLFAAFPGTKTRREGKSTGITTATLNDGIPPFINYWNGLADVTGRETIPVIEQDGVAHKQATLGNTPRIRNFRRTLAWHIANQPRGEIALAIQYGHVQLASSIGYAGRATSGFPQEVEMSFTISAWDTLAQLSESLDQGQAVSGPAGSRLLTAIRSFDYGFKGTVRNERQLNRFRSSGLSRIYDNPKSMLVCVFDERFALCRKVISEDGENVPMLAECQPKCPNIARADSHIAKGVELVSNGESLEGMPPLVRRRIESARESIRLLAEKHASDSAFKDWG